MGFFQTTKRSRCPIFDEKEYNLALSLLRRSTALPLNRRTKLLSKMYYKISYFKLERAFIHDPYLGKKVPRILIDGKILLPSNEIKKCVEAFYKSSKGDGAKKLCYATRESFYGIGEKTIQKHLNEMECHRTLNPRFDNRAPLQPVSAGKSSDRYCRVNRNSCHYR